AAPGPSGPKKRSGSTAGSSASASPRARAANGTLRRSRAQRVRARLVTTCRSQVLSVERPSKRSSPSTSARQASWTTSSATARPPPAPGAAARGGGRAAAGGEGQPEHGRIVAAHRGDDRPLVAPPQRRDLVALVGRLDPHVRPPPRWPVVDADRARAAAPRVA